MAAATIINKLLQSSSPLDSVVASDVLLLIKSAHLFLPHQVLEFGKIALSAHSPSSVLYWDLAEQVVQCACQIRRLDVAKSFLEPITTRFPKSSRALTLKGLVFESNSDWTKAALSYIEILESNPLYKTAHKRQVAVLKSQQKLPEAAALLHRYLEFFSDDFDAWAELCSISLQLERYAHALFAANELLVIDPLNHAAHVVSADIYATLGGLENLILARKHYVASLRARPAPNLRALYGLWLVCATILDGNLLEDGPEQHKSLRLFTVARKGITAVYANPAALSGGVFVATTLGSSIQTGVKRLLKS